MTDRSRIRAPLRPRSSFNDKRHERYWRYDGSFPDTRTYRRGPHLTTNATKDTDGISSILSLIDGGSTGIFVALFNNTNGYLRGRSLFNTSERTKAYPTRQRWRCRSNWSTRLLKWLLIILWSLPGGCGQKQQPTRWWLYWINTLLFLTIPLFLFLFPF